MPFLLPTGTRIVGLQVGYCVPLVVSMKRDISPKHFLVSLCLYYSLLPEDVAWLTRSVNLGRINWAHSSPSPVSLFCVVLAAPRKQSWFFHALASPGHGPCRDAWCSRSFGCSPSHLFGPSFVAAVAAVIQAQTQVAESPLQGMLQVIPLSASGTSLGLQETAWPANSYGRSARELHPWSQHSVNEETSQGMPAPASHHSDSHFCFLESPSKLSTYTQALVIDPSLEGTQIKTQGAQLGAL